MTAPETEAMRKLAEDFLSWKDLSMTAPAARIARAYLTLLATPQPTQTDEERARQFIIETAGPDYVSEEYVGHLVAEFAAVRAEGMEWPGTVPACPACMSTSDVEWGVCPVADYACPLKALPRSPEHTT